MQSRLALDIQQRDASVQYCITVLLKSADRVCIEHTAHNNLKLYFLPCGDIYVSSTRPTGKRCSRSSQRREVALKSFLVRRDLRDPCVHLITRDFTAV